MPVLTRVARVLVQALHSFLGALRWLAMQAYAQRSLGVASNPQLTRILDIHFVTVGAHVALISGLVVANPPVSTRDWLLGLPLLMLFTGLAIWGPNRLMIGILLALQLVFYVIAAGWAHPGILLALLFGLAVAQQAAVVRAARGRLGRATAAGLLLGVFTGGAGLVVGLIFPGFPLGICVLLLLIAGILALRMPAPQPRITYTDPKTITLQALPTQTVVQPTHTVVQPTQPKTAPTQTARQPQVPEGYTVYRPSSLDDPREG